MIKQSKINGNWKKIFEKYNILSCIKKDGGFIIKASQIGEFHEARLMTKFDNVSQLPTIFEENSLSILPTTRGSYIIAPIKAYHNFPKIDRDEKINYVSFPEHIQSLSPNDISSESAALNCAYLSGILEDFINDTNLKPTISGRMSSNSFEFEIENFQTNNKTTVIVENSQMEIDGGYEGAETLSIIEAKNNLADDFMVRQLYYPFRRWQKQVDKKVKTIFLVYTNSVYYLYEYEFKDINDYNSLILTKVGRYAFDNVDITISEIEKIIQNVKSVSEPTLPFPQADSFDRVINLSELLRDNPLTKTEITGNYGFDKRQADYYASAGKYLGLLKQTGEVIALTEMGKSILDLPPKRRLLEFSKLILQHNVFKQSLLACFAKGNGLKKDEIVNIMKKCNLYKVTTDSTYKRRASTILSWINWILSLTH